MYKYAGVERLSFGLENPNHFAPLAYTFTIVGWVLSWHFLQQARTAKGWIRFLLIFAWLLASGSALLVCYFGHQAMSRGGALSMLLALLVLWLVGGTSRNYILVGAVLFASLAFFAKESTHRFVSGIDGDDASVVNRIVLWQRTVVMIDDSPNMIMKPKDFEDLYLTIYRPSGHNVFNWSPVNTYLALAVFMGLQWALLAILGTFFVVIGAFCVRSCGIISLMLTGAQIVLSVSAVFTDFMHCPLVIGFLIGSTLLGVSYTYFLAFRFEFLIRIQTIAFTVVLAVILCLHLYACSEKRRVPLRGQLIRDKESGSSTVIGVPRGKKAECAFVIPSSHATIDRDSRSELMDMAGIKGIGAIFMGKGQKMNGLYLPESLATTKNWVVYIEDCSMSDLGICLEKLVPHAKNLFLVLKGVQLDENMISYLQKVQSNEFIYISILEPRGEFINSDKKLEKFVSELPRRRSYFYVSGFRSILKSITSIISKTATESFEYKKN